MLHQHDEFYRSRLIRFGLALITWLTVASPLPAEEAGTNNLSNWSTNTSPREIGKKLADYMLPRWQITTPAEASLQDFLCLLQFSRQTQDETMRIQLIERIDPLLKQFEEDPKCLEQRADHSIFGAVLLEIYLQTGDARYLTSGRRLADRQWKNPRNDGLSGESRFRAEDMYLITALQLQAFRATADPVYLDRAALTLSVYSDKLQDGDGLFRHGLEAPHHWGRGNGFAGVGLAILLSDLPATHPERRKLMASYKKLIAAMVRHQSTSGVWHQLVDVPDSYAESSATALLTYALAVGIKNGWLSPEDYASTSRKGWLSLMDKIGNSGKVYQVSVAAEPSPSAEYYLNLPVQRGGWEGQTAVLRCALALMDQPQPQTK